MFSVWEAPLEVSDEVSLEVSDEVSDEVSVEVSDEVVTSSSTTSIVRICSVILLAASITI